MDDDVIRVAVGLRLGAPLCEPHHCQHAIVEMWWTIQEPTVLGVATARVAILAMPPSTRSSSDPLALQTSPATWNPQASTDLMENGLMACLSFRGREGKCWCGMPLVQILWHHHTSLWHQERQVQWQRRPRSKYAHLEESHYFVPVAVEAMGVFGPEARSFLRELGDPIANATQDPLSHLYLRQRISVAVQRGNTAAILGPTVGSDYLGDFSSH